MFWLFKRSQHIENSSLLQSALAVNKRLQSDLDAACAGWMAAKEEISRINNERVQVEIGRNARLEQLVEEIDRFRKERIDIDVRFGVFRNEHLAIERHLRDELRKAKDEIYRLKYEQRYDELDY